MKTTVTSFILILIIASNLYSQGIPYGQEFQVNTFTQNDQKNPVVAPLKEGGFMVCWQSNEQDGSEWGIYGQLFDHAGSKKGEEFRVNSFTNRSQYNPSLTVLKDGKILLCWQSLFQTGSFYDIIGQIFDEAGNKSGEEFPINTYIDDWQDFPSVAALQDGGFVVCWRMWHRDRVYYQIYDSLGAKKGDEVWIPVDFNNYTDVEYPIIHGFDNSGFMICWTNDPKSIYYSNVFGQLFDNLGNKRGDVFQINTYTMGYQCFPSVAFLNGDKFIVCWQSTYQDGSGFGIFGQMFDSSGDKDGNEFQVNTYTNDEQRYPYAVSLSNGKFLICWASRKQNGFRQGIFGQFFDSSGIKYGSEFPIIGYKDSWQAKSYAAVLKDSGIVVCWEDWGRDGQYYGIFGKYFLAKPMNHIMKNFSLIEPLFDATLRINNPTFRWQQPSSIRECYPWELTFDLYIDTDSNFPHPQIIKNIEDTTYTIGSLAAGKTYFWKVLAKNLAGDSLWSKQQDWGFFIKPGATLVETAEQNLPTGFELFQNYPNPFNSSTEIRYSLPQGKPTYHVTLKICDVLGRLVKVLVDQEQSAGSYAISWDGTDLRGNRVASGVYFYSLEVGDIKSIRKMLVLQ